VPRATVATVASLVQRAFSRAVPSPRGHLSGSARSGRSGATLLYNPLDPNHNITGAEAVAFLSRVDLNHDFQVSRQELSRFLSSQVDLNHDGKISLYEQMVLQLHDPQAARFLFPGA
jgi:hypothetical protein